MPTCCVVTGVETDKAARLWAVQSRRVDWLIGFGGIIGVLAARLVGREVMRISLPISDRSWGIWRRREAGGVLLLSFGAGAIVAGITRPLTALAVLGIISVALGITVRARAFVNFWISVQLRPETKDIQIRRSHPTFNEAARDLYLRSLGLR